MPALHELFIHDVRLKQLQLQNFRGFGNVMLDFHPDKPVTVLIADNGGGKSTILDTAAEFLRRFFQLAIVGKSENEDNKDALLGENDIFNERKVATASAVLNLSYPYPDKEIVHWMDDCAQHLDENHVEGEEAALFLEEEIWTLLIKQNEEFFTYDLPDKFQKLMEDFIVKKILHPEDNFKVAVFDDKVKDAWRANLRTDGDIPLSFELKRNNPAPVKHHTLNPIPTSFSNLINARENGQAFIQHYAESTSQYNRFDPLNQSNEILPLLVYYGGSTINTKFDGELKLPYRPRAFQAYHNAFKPDRFDFEEFLAWALWASEKQAFAWELVKKTILDVMNADQLLYKDIRIEAQMLFFDKKTRPEDENAVPVEIFQLSAGEKNIVALVGDLVKRAVQLNVILFNVDFDPNEGTLSNPLTYTPGIVLIDEIDLHLHPRWQRVIVPKLREHFPRVQFVVTTHSPFVLQSVSPAQRIRINNWQPEYFENEPVVDYEATLMDYFMVEGFFDLDTEKELKEFRRLLREVGAKRKDKKDTEFIEIIKSLSEKGDIIKRVIAVELVQLTKNDQAHDEN